MSWSEEIISEPISEPIDLVTAKTHLRVDHAADDEYIQALITTARQRVEDETGLLLGSQQWNFWRSHWPRKTWSHLFLPRAPIGSIGLFEYRDLGETVTTVDAGIYTTMLRKRAPCAIVLKFAAVWPPVPLSYNQAIHVQYTGGDWGTPGIPQQAKSAMLLLIGHWYENRLAVTVGKKAAVGSAPLAFGVDRLLSDLRVYPFGMVE